MNIIIIRIQKLYKSKRKRTISSWINILLCILKKYYAKQSKTSQFLTVWLAHSTDETVEFLFTTEKIFWNTIYNINYLLFCFVVYLLRFEGNQHPTTAKGFNIIPLFPHKVRKEISSTGYNNHIVEKCHCNHLILLHNLLSFTKELVVRKDGI